MAELNFSLAAHDLFAVKAAPYGVLGVKETK
jgi:hypothetical protein